MRLFPAAFYVLVLTSFLPYQAEATSYGPLLETLREQRINPGPEADAKVRRTHLQAAIIEISFTVIPVLLVGYMLIRVCSKRAPKK